jgi:hypothetical protein
MRYRRTRRRPQGSGRVEVSKNGIGKVELGKIDSYRLLALRWLEGNDSLLQLAGSKENVLGRDRRVDEPPGDGRVHREEQQRDCERWRQWEGDQMSSSSFLSTPGTVLQGR